MKSIKKAIVLFISLLSGAEGFSYFLTGSGHYAIRPEFRTNPDVTSSSSYFSLNQSFRLLGELKVNERASFYAELRLFGRQRDAKLGDGITSEEGASANVFYPVYKLLQPKISKLYMTYATDYASFEVGRRPRSWAQGLLYDTGDKPFSNHASIFDGITASLTPGVAQNLSFMLGYDLLQDNLLDATGKDTYLSFFHQVFGAVSYNTIKEGGSKAIATDIGLYFSHMFDPGQEDKAIIPASSLNFFDAYFNFAFQSINLEWKNEILGIWGKAAPSKIEELGAKDSGEQESLGSISFASQLAWTFLESGSYNGPKEFSKGNYKKNVFFFDFVYLPGASEGAKDPAERTRNKATAFKANENFKKTLILFSGKPGLENNSLVKVDGIYDPYKMTNVHLYSVGYRYEDVTIGNFEARLTHARLQSTHGVANKVGNSTNGTSLGFEADLSYWISFGQDITVGADIGLLIPGPALTTNKDPATSILAQASVTFNL